MVRSGKLAAMMLGAACWCAAMAAPDARAADKIIAGTLGGQAPLWPFYIAADKGFYAADNIDLELNFATSGASVIQQLTGGSLDAVVSVGLTEPLQAIDKGAPLALIRIIGKTAPYALVAKPTIKTIAGLRGKTISIGAIADIISIYFDRMMSANGLKKGDYDVLSAGVAAARYAALRAGEADAAMVLPPINFHAAAENYPTIGLAADYVKDVPFTGMIVSRAWGTAHRALARRLLDATSKSIAWLADTANRAEAIAILVKRAHATPGDAAASYDFKRRIAYFEPGDQVSRSQLQNLITIEAGQGYVDKALTVERLALPGLTELGP